MLKLFYLILGTSNCGNNNGGCKQLCFHKVPTGTSCGCQLGLKLSNDSKSCEDAFKDGKGIVFRNYYKELTDLSLIKLIL